MKVHLIVGAIACAAAFGAQAQYKYIGPDGRVVYSDQPPPAAAKGVEKKAATPQSSGGATVPFAVQQAIKNFPVTLYTAPNCGAPCNDARNLLTQRGVPFSEKTVSTQEDAAAFRKTVNSEQLPVMMVGSGKQVQFQRDTWNGALNAAGYPATSQLPAGYQNPPPTALAPPAGATPAPGSQTAQSAPPAPPSTAPTPPGAEPAPADRPAWFKGF